MLSQRHNAQLGLVAAAIILAASVFFLVAGSSDLQPQATLSDKNTPPLADTQLPVVHVGIGK
jgi:hypothetical protein